MGLNKFEKLIRDAEWRIGSYIAQGGNQEDIYVKEQIARIRRWEIEAAKISDKE